MAREIFVNKNPKTLGSAITNGTVTSMTLSDVTGLPTYGIVRALIDSEIVTAILTGSTTVTIVRAVDGTTATSHSSGVAVNFIITAEALNQFRQENIGYDTYANRLSNGFPGAVWFDSDSPTIARDNGTTWDTFWDTVKVTRPDLTGAHYLVYANPTLTGYNMVLSDQGFSKVLKYTVSNAGSHQVGMVGFTFNPSSTVDWTATIGIQTHASNFDDIIAGLGFYEISSGVTFVWGINVGAIANFQSNWYNTTNSGSAASSFGGAVGTTTLNRERQFRYMRVKYVHASSTTGLFFYTSHDMINWVYEGLVAFSSMNMTRPDYVGLAMRDYLGSTSLGAEPAITWNHWSYSEP